MVSAEPLVGHENRLPHAFVEVHQNSGLQQLLKCLVATAGDTGLGPDSSLESRARLTRLCGHKFASWTQPGLELRSCVEELEEARCTWEKMPGIGRLSCCSPPHSPALLQHGAPAGWWIEASVGGTTFLF